MASNHFRSKSVTVSAPGFVRSDGINAGQNAVIPIDLKHFHKGVGIVCTVTGAGSCVYEIDVTADDPRYPFVNWNKLDTMSALTASANSNLAYPATGLRLNMISQSGVVSVTMAVTQPLAP